MESNDDWVDSPEQTSHHRQHRSADERSRISDRRDAPGNGASYTAVLRGVNDTTGIAVVEVYALQ